MTAYIFTEAAKAELESALAYYRAEARPGTTEKFIQSVDDAIVAVLGDPDGRPLFRRNLRRQRVWRFPYDLLFRHENEVVTIVAVVYHAREPGYWMGR